MQTPLTKPQGPKQAFDYYGPSLGGPGAEEMGVLADLGLTSRQARVYLALLKTGGGKAKIVADVSLVNRQEIYRIIEDLQQMGLVQKNVTAPTTFTATPLADVIKRLLEQKTKQLTLIRQKAKQLTKHPQIHISVAPAEKPCLGTIFEGDRGKKYQQAIQTTQHNIDIVTSWRRFKQLTTLLETPLQNALQKGVPIHIITEKPPNQSLPNWITNVQTQTLNKKSYLKLKILPNPPTAAVTIFDNTQTAITFHPNTNLTKGPDLWTTNPTLLTLSQTYFNTIWTQTKPKKQLP